MPALTVAPPVSRATEAPVAPAAPADPAVTAAARSLFETYEQPVLRYCRARLRSRDEAEDAMQNTFLRAFTALQRGVVPEFPSAWLFKIAHNVCLSARLRAARRNRVEALRDFDATADETPAREPEVDDLFDLDDALAAMPEKLRTPFLLREWQGLSYNEIANALQTSHSAVETLIFRARRHLATAMSGTTKGAV